MRYCPTCGSRYADEVAFCPHDGIGTQALVEQAAAGTDPLLGQVLDSRYRVDKQVGEGGMGVVYLATHTSLKKKLALKVLRGDLARDKDVVQRFMQEAQAATSIGHENIIDISDFGSLPDGSVYFVMEFLDGESLANLISRGGSLPTRDAVTIIRQIASALSAAHGCGIVHRDLKPDNIFVNRRDGGEPFVKVLDFGIAKVGGGSSKLTRTGMIFGTPHYMAPEQAAGQGVDHRADIYALGVIMYEMFTGKVPFDADTFMAVLSKHMFEQPTPPSQIAGREVGAFESIIMRALEKKPELRYQAMAELIEDLSRIAVGGEVHFGARALVGVTTGLADDLEPPSNTEMGLLAPVLPRNRGPVYAGIAGALVLVLGGLGFVVFGGGEEDAAAAAPATAPGATAPPAAAPPPRAAAPTEVALESIPAGAQVLVDGVILGTTPADVPLPPEGGTRSVEVRLAGHLSQTLTLEHGSAGPMTVQLQAVAAAPAAGAVVLGRPRRGRSSSSAVSAVVDPPPPVVREAPPPRRQRTAAPSEVLDPWAN
jgi:serine/threonine-protein kinase